MAIARRQPLGKLSGRKLLGGKLSGRTAFGAILAAFASFQYLPTISQYTATNMVAPAEQRPLFTGPSSSLPNLEQEVYEQINRHRASRNLPPLTIDARLSEQARNHSQEMASGQIPFNKEGFAPKSDAIAKEFPGQEIAGTLVWNSGYAAPAQAAVSYWLRSADLDNSKSLPTIEGQYELTGIGVATNLQGRYYFTQIFAGRR